MLDHQLYLPESWCEETEECWKRREKVQIPERVAFQTKPQIAAGLIRMTLLLGVVTLDWITADEEYGRNGEFLDELETLGHRYVVEVPVNTTVWTEDPASCVPPYGGRGRVPTLPSRESVASVVMIASELSGEAWQTLKIREGAKGPLAFEFAAVRVWAVRHGKAGPPVWLLIRRSLDPTPEVKYYISNADASTPLEVLAEVACTRHAVEDYFEDGKSDLGMAQYETRSWVGWHHHMSLVAMAHLFITQTQRVLKKKPPQQNLWVRFGSGSCPRLCNKANLATFAVRNPYDFLVTSFTLLFRPSTAPDEIAPRARNQFKISG
jgi:SRSO17 transposase